jgi:hypothetical protein
VDKAQAELDAVEVKQQSPLVQPTGRIDFSAIEWTVVPPDVPRQRIFLTAGIEKVVVRRGKEPIEKRAKIKFID